MKKISYVLIFVFSFVCAASVFYAAEDKSVVDAIIDTAANIVKAPLSVASDKGVTAGKEISDKTKGVKKEFTKEEMLEHVLFTLEHEEEVLNYIPELRKEKGPEGKFVYRYRGVRLEDLDEKNMREAFRRINNEASRIRMERLNKQLENIRRSQQAVEAANRAAAQQRIISQSVMSQPPKPPPSIPRPPQIPQIPKPPPQPPTRQR